MGFFLALVALACAPSTSANEEESATAEADSTSSETGGIPTEDMVLVSSGSFAMGCDSQWPSSCPSDELPVHQVTLSAFEIDRTEVTVAGFRACVEMGACPQPNDFDPPNDGSACNFSRSDREDHPVNCVSRPQAVDYCTWRGARLPTEAEWEYAARGDSASRFPWGDEDPTCTRANTSVSSPCGDAPGTVPVGSAPLGVSPFGALDMVGNVREVVADWYAAGYYDTSPESDPPGPAEGDTHPITGEPAHSARGGGFGETIPEELTVAARSSSFDGSWDPQTGFRCARSVG